MRRICFEITDILWHAYRRNSRVTGIQRVQLNLIRYLAKRYGGVAIRCVFFDWRRKCILEFDPNDLFDAGEYDGEALLRKLGVLWNWKLLPGKFQVSEYLTPYRHRKLLRAWKKLQIYVWSVWCPSQFAATGLRRTSDTYPNLRRILTARIDDLPATDSVVFLGGSPVMAQVTEIGRRHAAKGGDVVQMMHDLIPRLHPEYCTAAVFRDFNSWLSVVSEFVSRFICVSESTAQDLRSSDMRLGVAKITTVPLAHEFEGYPRNSRLPEQLLPQVLSAATHGFVLCVGTIEIRKNGAALLRSWLQLHQKLGEQMPLLVFAGKRGWLTDEFDGLLAENQVLAAGVVILDSPQDKLLAALYGHCLFTVFPSFYEGWGLPIGESAWFGKYCVASNAASMPEVCGDLMGYIDPCDQISLSAALMRALTDVEYRRQCEAKIRAAPLRTWQQVAERLYGHIARDACSVDS